MWVQVAALAYSIYSSRRQAKKQQAANREALQDRTVTIRSGDAPHEIVYGRVRKGGTIAYAVSPTATQPTFAMVVLLASHECDGLEAVYIGDERYAWDAATGRLTSPTAQQLRYARYDVADQVEPFVVDGARRINVGAGITTISVSSSNTTDVFGEAVHGELGFSEALDPSTLAPTGVVTVPGASPGQTVYVITRRRQWRSWVRVKFFSGTQDQAADAELMSIAPAGEWTANHRIRGRCYAVVYIDPDPTVFTDGLPEFSFVLRGRRLVRANGTVGWSRNPAEILRDYLATYARVPSSIIEPTAFLAAAAQCDEQVLRDGVTYIARYTCDTVLLRDDTKHRDRVQTLLSAMMGTLVPVGAQAVMRAAAWEAPTVTLDNADLIGPVVLNGFQSGDDLFNAVRGRYFDGEDAPGTPAARSYQRINFAPYVSPTYVAQDGGRLEYDDVDLPCTVDSVRAQRLAKLYLFRARQALTIAATWKLAGWAAPVGGTVRLRLTRYGWDTIDGGLGKVFRVRSARYDFDRLTVHAVMQEEAQAIYDWDYSEADGRDPAPNTAFPTWREIDPPSNLRILTGTAYVRTRGDGTREPFARIEWDQSTEPSVLAGGWLELEWLLNDSTEWAQAGRLDPYATAYHVAGVVAADLLRVRLRAANPIATSVWRYSFATVNPAAGPGTSSPGVGVGVNAVAGAKLRPDEASGDSRRFSVYYVPTATGLKITNPETVSNAVSTPGPGTTFTYVLDALYGVSGYGRLTLLEEGTLVPIGRRAVLYSDDPFPVQAGDVWEVQAWLHVGTGISGQTIPGLTFYNAAGGLLADSWDVFASGLPLVSSNNVPSPRRLNDSLGRSYTNIYAFVVVPQNAVIARWSIPMDVLVSIPNPGLVVSLPFAARAIPTSEAALRSNPLTYLTPWNG